MFSGLGDIVAVLGVDDKQFRDKLDGANRSIEEHSEKINKILNVALAAGAGAFFMASKKAAEFEKKMQEVGSLLGNQSKDQLAKYNKELLKLSSSVPLDLVDDLASGMYEIVSANVSLNDQMAVLESSSRAAVAGVSDLSSTFKLGSSIIKGYSLDWKDINDVYDIVFQTIKYGQTNMTELAASFGSSVPLAAKMGVSLEELSGAVASLAGVSGNTSEVLTQIDGLFSAMIKPTGELEKAFERLGVQSGEELISKFGGLGGAIQELKNYTEKYNVNVGDLIGQKEALVSFFQLSGAGAKDFAEKTKLMHEANGAFTEAFEIQMESFSNQGKVFVNTIQRSFVDTGQRDFLPIMTDILKMFNAHPEAMKTVISVAVELGVAIAGLIAVFKAYNAVAKLTKSLNVVSAAAFGPVALAIGAVASAAIILNQVFEAQEQAFYDQVDAISDSVGHIEKLEIEYQRLIDKAEPTRDEQKRLKEVTDELTEAYKEAQKGTGDYSTSLTDLIGKYRDLRIEKLKDEQKKLNDEYDKAVNKSGLWHGLLIGLGNAIGKTSLATDIYTGNVEKLEKKQAALSKELKELETNEKALNEIGITTQAQVEKKIEIYEGLLKQLKPNTLQHRELSKEIQNLKEKLDDVNPEVDTYAENQKKLEKAGITTTDSINKQIKELENLYLVVKNDSVATQELSEKIDSLKVTVQAAKNTELLKNEAEKLGKEIKLTDDSVGKIRGTFTELTPLIEENQVAMVDLSATEKELNSEAKKTNDEWVQYAQYLGEISNKFNLLGPTGKEALNLISTALTGAFDPMTLGLNSLNLMLEFYQNTPKAFIDANKLMAESLGELANEMDVARESLKALQETYDFDLLNDYQAELDELEGQYQSLVIIQETQKNGLAELNNVTEEASGSMLAGTNSANFFENQLNDLKEEIQDVTGEMENLTFAFDLSSQFDEIYSSLTQLTEESKELINQFGNIDTSGLNELLRESITNSTELLTTLDPTSQAYKDLAGAIFEAYLQLANMGGDVAGIQELFESMGLSVQDLMDLYYNLNEGLQETKEKLKQTGDGVNDFTHKLRDLIPYMGDLEKKNLPQLGDGFRGLREVIENVNEPLPLTSEYLRNLRDDAEPIPKTFKDISDSVEDTTDSLFDLSIQWNDTLKSMTGTYTEFEKSVKEITEMIQALLFFNVDLDTSTADEEIAKMILNLQDYLATLDPNSEAYKQAKESIEALIWQFVELGGNIFDITTDMDILREYLRSMMDLDVNINLNYNTKGDPPPEFHTGGLIRAHTGRLFSDEMMAVLKAGEFVLRPETVKQFTPVSMEAFNVTGNPDLLNSNQSNKRDVQDAAPQQNFSVIVHEANPSTWIEITDNYIHPRINHRDRNFQVGPNPY